MRTLSIFGMQKDQNPSTLGLWPTWHIDQPFILLGTLCKGWNGIWMSMGCPSFLGMRGWSADHAKRHLMSPSILGRKRHLLSSNQVFWIQIWITLRHGKFWINLNSEGISKAPSFVAHEWERVDWYINFRWVVLLEDSLII